MPKIREELRQTTNNKSFVKFPISAHTLGRKYLAFLRSLEANRDRILGVQKELEDILRESNFSEDRSNLFKFFIDLQKELTASAKVLLETKKTALDVRNTVESDIKQNSGRSSQANELDEDLLAILNDK